MFEGKTPAEVCAQNGTGKGTQTTRPPLGMTVGTRTAFGGREARTPRKNVEHVPPEQGWLTTGQSHSARNQLVWDVKQ